MTVAIRGTGCVEVIISLHRASVTIQTSSPTITMHCNRTESPVGRKPIGTAAMTSAERVQRYRLKHASVTKHNEIQEKEPCKYCGEPGEQIKGIGWFSDGDGKPRQLYCLLWQIQWYAEHPHTKLDVTFYSREPILEVTLDKHFASELCKALLYDKGTECLKDLFSCVRFSDGTVAAVTDIWTLNYMPDNLNTAGTDLSQGNRVAGSNGETVRQIISETYHCRSRAEEDYFLARWIAP